MAKILIWDLECTDLKSDWGTLLCVGYKYLGDEQPTVISIMDYEGWEKDVTNDRKLVTAFHKILSECDMQVTFYGKMFDMPWMTGKFLEYELAPLPNIPHVDLFFTARSNMRITRKSLDSISKYLHLPQKKYYVEGALWKLARVGNPEAIKKVIQHCAADIKVTEALYHRLRPLVRMHPRVNGYEACAACGSKKLQRRGKALSTTKGARQRVQCQGCGSWSLRPWDEVLPGEIGE
jgi:uncharacterized protein YprB with RNaseH-like and TPR domain